MTQETKRDAPAETPGKENMLKKEREFVVPGEKLVESMDYLPGKNCYRRGDSIFAMKIGFLSVSGRVVSVVALNEVYVAKAGDMIIGEVKEIQSNGWVIDIGSTTEAFLPLSGVKEFIDTTKTDLSKYYTVGDVLYAKISSSGFNSIHISMDDSRARKFRTGRIIKFNAAKVPRLIGKQGSMISLIKTRTGCRISVGQNGIVWLEGDNENKALEAIKLVEDNAHVEGLTDRVSAFLGGGLHEPDPQTEETNEKPVEKAE